jgi:hypothetical protein
MDYKFNARLLRRTFRRFMQTVRYGTLADSPVLFANSFPKSGTHLLTQVLGGFARLGPAVDLLCSPGFATYFILRDPRDVVVSHVHYVAEMAPNHIHHDYYHEVLQSFEQRLEASIAGVPREVLQEATGRSVPEGLPDIRSRFEPFTAWLEQPEVLSLRYEDFITNRSAAVLMVLDHAIRGGFQLACSAEEAARILERSIDPEQSPTFRSGKIGGWREAFQERQLSLFREVTGDLLERLGYEDAPDV